MITITARVTHVINADGDRRYFVELSTTDLDRRILGAYSLEEARRNVTAGRKAAAWIGMGWKLDDETGDLFPVIKGSRVVRRKLYADFVAGLGDADVKYYGFERAAAESIADHRARGLAPLSV